MLGETLPFGVRDEVLDLISAADAGNFEAMGEAIDLLAATMRRPPLQKLARLMKEHDCSIYLLAEEIGDLPDGLSCYIPWVLGNCDYMIQFCEGESEFYAELAKRGLTEKENFALLAKAGIVSDEKRPPGQIWANGPRFH